MIEPKTPLIAAKSPLLLAGALHQLERLSVEHNFRLGKTRRIGPGSGVDLLDLENLDRVRFELVMQGDAAPKKVMKPGKVKKEAQKSLKEKRQEKREKRKVQAK